MQKINNDLIKNSIRRGMVKLGLRIQKAAYLPFSYERRNYPDPPEGEQSVIFDVGANIGQSALWYSKEFKDSIIHCFEPFPSIFRKLEQTTAADRRIHIHQIALSDSTGEIKVARVENPFCQTGNMRSIGSGDSEVIRTEQIDDFTKQHNIRHIHVLKTDTEGGDLRVLAGATRTLRERRISSILVEATIQPEDEDHTQLSALQDFLLPYDLKLRSLFDLNHSNINGRVAYLNALFIRE